MKPKFSSETVQGAVLTVFVGALETLQAERVPMEELWELFRQRRDIGLGQCKAVGGILLGAAFPFIQLLFHQGEPDNSGFIQSAVSAAGAMYRAETEHAVQRRKNGGSTYGIAAGTVHAARLSKIGRGETAAIGLPVSLSRKLAAEGNRYGYPLLLDDAAGGTLSGAVPMGKYRIPGPAEIYTLYGFDLSGDDSSMRGQIPGADETRPLDGIRSYKISEIF